MHVYIHMCVYICICTCTFGYQIICRKESKKAKMLGDKEGLNAGNGREL